MPHSPAPTEEIHDGSEEHHTLLQTIPKEILAASAKEIVQPEENEDAAPPPQPEGFVRSTDTETVPMATPDEVAKADALTNKADSIGLPHPILDVRKMIMDWQPKSALPRQTGQKTGKRP